MTSKIYYSNFRDTFGLIDPMTKKQYADIIRAFLAPRYITAEDFDIGYIPQNGCNYILHCDHSVRTTLGMEGYACCLISYQHRTNGLYAIARLVKERGEH